MFFVGVAVGETFTCRTDVEILTGHVAEVLLAEAPIGLGVRGHGFGNVTVMPASSHARISVLLK